MTRTLLLLLMATPLWAIADHPRLWITPAWTAQLLKKACVNSDRTAIAGCTPEADYLAIKADADAYLTAANPTFTITSATNSNPVVFTIQESVPNFRGTGVNLCNLKDAAGRPRGWSSLNVCGVNTADVVATWVDEHRFSVPFNSTDWGPFLEQNSSGTVRNYWRNFYQPGYLPYPVAGGEYLGLGFYNAVRELYWAYAATGNPEYANKAIGYAMMLADFASVGLTDPIELNNGYASRSYMVGVAMVYDWFYPLLTPSQKSSLVALLNAWYDNLTCCGFELLTSQSAQGNFWGGHLLGIAAAGYATYGENPRDAGASNPLIAAATAAWTNVLLPALTPPAGTLAGGQPLESYNYGGTHEQRLLQYMEAVRTATGTDLGIAAAAKTFARNLLYNLKPDRYRSTTWGTWPGDPPGQMPGNLALYLAWLIDGTQEAAWMQFMYGNFAACPVSGGCRATQRGGLVDRYLWADSTRAASDYRNVADPFYFSTGDGTSFVRSDWTDNAVWAAFLASSQHVIDHQDHILGHVEVQVGSDYILPSMNEWGGVTGFTGSPGHTRQTNWWSNTLCINDYGAYMDPSLDYYGCGQSVGGAWRAPAQKMTADYAYVMQDLTGLYAYNRLPASQRALRYWYRAFLWLGDGTIVVQDRSRVLQAGFQQNLRWMMTAANPPSVSGRTASTTLGNSTAYVNTVLPRSAAVALRDAGEWTNAAVNGDGTTRTFTLPKAVSRMYAMVVGTYGGQTFCEQGTGACQWYWTPGSATITQDPTQTPLPSGARMLITYLPAGFARYGYYLETGNAQPATDLDALTVIYAGPSTIVNPPMSALGDNGTTISAGFAGVQIEGPAPKVAVFGTGVIDNGNNTYTSAAAANVAFQTTHGGTAKYVIGGLAPGPYTITLNGTPYLANQTVGADGTLYFTAPSGAFSIDPVYKISVDPSPLPGGVVGTPYAATFMASGGTGPYTYSAAGLPAGFTLNATSGALSGTPSGPGAYTATITATDATLRQIAASFPLAVRWRGLAIAPPNPPRASRGTPFLFRPSADGGDGFYTWSISPGALPPGLSLSSDGTIQGSPEAPGVYRITLEVTSGDGQAARLPLTLVIDAGPPAFYFKGGHAAGVVVR